MRVCARSLFVGGPWDTLHTQAAQVSSSSIRRAVLFVAVSRCRLFTYSPLGLVGRDGEVGMHELGEG